MDRSTSRLVQVDWCASCNDLVEMISASDAAEVADASVRAIYRWAEARRIHHKLTPERSLLICLKSRFFVKLHYLDFLNREPDRGGWDFWTNNIDNCAPKPSCIAAQRINTSAAYFLSIEFQQTGYLVERTYKAAYGDASSRQ